ncbi:ABC transporter permease [Tessaracoccus sp. SD287]|uniref:ABC transporter permease n=1 Tax=Tessaracoccus sp. SD287 TaxID=2782008 RepID=UPI001A967A1D|nr:ABC transporter permease [Tessaracoccus sp. SD287]MBO1031448.1 ABC transporter permease [Tessaracoccus sp. SD287]
MSEVVSFVQLMLTSMAVFVLAAQGTALAGRAGVFIVSQEGYMTLGASLGFVVGWATGSNFVGILVAGLAGVVLGLVMAVMTTTYKLDQFVVGLALLFLAMGLATLIYKVSVGVTLTPPLINTLERIEIPLLSDIPYLGPILTQDAMVWFALFISLVIWWVLYRTNLGLKVRSVGENPKASDSLGVNVTRVRLVTTALGSALICMAGAYLPMAFTGTYTEGIVGGRGWLVIALAFFGGWRPTLIMGGAAFFAGLEVLALRAQVGGLGIPHQFISMLPFVATLLVMVFALRWVREPAFLGKNHDREARH